MNSCLSLNWTIGPLTQFIPLCPWEYKDGENTCEICPKIKIHINQSVRKFTMFVLEEWNILFSVTKNKILCDSLFYPFLSSMPWDVLTPEMMTAILGILYAIVGKRAFSVSTEQMEYRSDYARPNSTNL